MRPEPYVKMQDDKATERCPHLRIKHREENGLDWFTPVCELSSRTCIVEYGNYPCYVYDEFKKKKEG
jgi:hypothetical protein